MNGKKSSIVLTFFIIFCVISVGFSSKPMVEGKQQMYFTLVAKTNTGGVRPDYLFLIKEQVARIGINLDVILQDWPTFVGELIAFRNFDLCYISLTGGAGDPDFTGVYNENGSLNLFGYHTDMDYDEALGTGKNEWYMRQGNLIMPPDSEERVAHYWEWQQYLMDKILPLQPMFSPRNYEAHWSNLSGYNISDGVLQSWGKMNWTGTHTGQITNTEVVVSMPAWSDLNPMFQDDTSSKFISSATMDSLIWSDNDNSVWPHLAKSIVHLSDTHVRITIREGIKWQTDPDGNFTDEYLDAEDVFFTLYTWTHISGDCRFLCEWLEDVIIVDKYTIDLIIDGDRGTPEHEPHAPYLTDLNIPILPEHFLNQTQDVTGFPDCTHSSWNTFANHCFGTGLFEIDTFTEDVETILTVYPECWRMNSTITNDPDLNWTKRFGDFTGGLDQLRIKHLGDFSLTLGEFENGLVDIADIGSSSVTREPFESNLDFTVQSQLTWFFAFVGYNMRPVRPVIGNPDPWRGDESITNGLAVRKAISYAIDREEINQLIHEGAYTITDHPIYTKMGVWCNSNIIKYNHDLDKAMVYMNGLLYQTSYELDTNNYPLFLLSEILLCALYLLKKKK